VADSFTIPTIDPGATLTVDYTVLAGEGTLSNTVTAGDNEGDGPNTDTDTNTDITAGTLSILKAPAAGQTTTVETGSNVTYTITIMNLGTETTSILSDVLVSESLPGTWTASGLSDALDITNASLVTIDGQDLTIETIDPDVTLTVNYTIVASEGVITNTVTAGNNGGYGPSADTNTNTDITGTSGGGGGGSGGSGGSGGDSSSVTPLPESGDENGLLLSFCALLLLGSGMASLSLAGFSRRRSQK
jgi:uncharacterized repeat protein (TIGR01451 family)